MRCRMHPLSAHAWRHFQRKRWALFPHRAGVTPCYRATPQSFAKELGISCMPAMEAGQEGGEESIGQGTSQGSGDKHVSMPDQAC